jgi:excinuclease ABC subunit B
VERSALGGDTVEILPGIREQGVRIELWGDEIERISKINALTVRRSRCSSAQRSIRRSTSSHRGRRWSAPVSQIRQELSERLEVLRRDGKLLEAQRLESRTHFDIEMMMEIGTCAGIEKLLAAICRGAWRESDRRCLFDYFPEEFLVIVDESHVTLPQVRGMYNGDRARKLTLVDYGFRLPSALDNRPLVFDEFLALTPRALMVSATPAELELQLSEGVVVEQIIPADRAPGSGDRSPPRSWPGRRPAE